MRIFIIGGTGYVGRAIARALVDASHEAVVLARSEASAAKVADKRVQITYGQIEDAAAIADLAAAADGTIYTAISGLTGATGADFAAIDAVLAAYRGSSKPFVLTSGMGVYLGVDAPLIRPDTNTDNGSTTQAWRRELEHHLLAAAADGVRPVVLRPPTIYGAGTTSGAIRRLLDHVAGGGRSVHIGTGEGSIPAVHVADLASAFVAAIDRAPAGTAWNIASHSVYAADLADAISTAAGDGSPSSSVSWQEALDEVGPFLAGTLAIDMKVSTVDLRRVLGWRPSAPDLLSTLLDKTT